MRPRSSQIVLDRPRSSSLVFAHLRSSLLYSPKSITINGSGRVERGVLSQFHLADLLDQQVRYNPNRECLVDGDRLAIDPPNGPSGCSTCSPPRASAPSSCPSIPR